MTACRTRKNRVNALRLGVWRPLRGAGSASGREHRRNGWPRRLAPRERETAAPAAARPPHALRHRTSAANLRHPRALRATYLGLNRKTVDPTGRPISLPRIAATMGTVVPPAAFAAFPDFVCSPGAHARVTPPRQDDAEARPQPLSTGCLCPFDAETPSFAHKSGRGDRRTPRDFHVPFDTLDCATTADPFAGLPVRSVQRPTTAPAAAGASRAASSPGARGL